MTNQTNQKSFNDFLHYRWTGFYKPIVSIVAVIGVIIFIITGLALGAAQLWDLAKTLSPNVIKIGLPIVSVVIIFIGIEYSAYKKFMQEDKQPFIPQYEE